MHIEEIMSNESIRVIRMDRHVLLFAPGILICSISGVGDLIR